MKNFKMLSILLVAMLIGVCVPFTMTGCLSPQTGTTLPALPPAQQAINNATKLYTDANDILNIAYAVGGISESDYQKAKQGLAGVKSIIDSAQTTVNNGGVVDADSLLTTITNALIAYKNANPKVYPSATTQPTTQSAK